MIVKWPTSEWDVYYNIKYDGTSFITVKRKVTLYINQPSIFICGGI